MAIGLFPILKGTVGYLYESPTYSINLFLDTLFPRTYERGYQNSPIRCVVKPPIQVGIVDLITICPMHYHLILERIVEQMASFHGGADAPGGV